MLRIAELENELTVKQSFHSKSLVTLKAHFLEKKKNYEQQAEDKLRALTTSAIRVSKSTRIIYNLKSFDDEDADLSLILTFL